ncbi:hypothetical protein O6H91_Y498100 [Diphasiastrum complanatum]|nr:hypothetical protein O6H91_Y498100 [Diphasiastrum complanatum]
MGNCMSWCELLGGLGSQKALRRTFSFHCYDLSYRNSRKYDPGKEQKSYLDSEGKVTVLDRTTEDLEVHYDLGPELGRGQFGLIRLCTDKQTGERFACKSIQKSKLVTAADVADVRREIRVMQRLAGHPNIVELKAVYEDEEWVHLVMELCEGGELFDYITKKKTFTEEAAAQVCKTLMEVLQFCHAKGVIHRDLKPENILLGKRGSLLPIKVADFGLAINMRRGERFFGMAGSAYYIAPEVLRGDYGPEIDVWSAGVILYILLSGVPPFWDDTEDGIFEAIQFGHLDLSSSPWPSMSSAVKDLLKGMMCPDVKRRLTPEQVLSHRWILRNCSSSDAEFPLTLPTDNSYSWNAWPTLRTSSESSFSSESEASDSAEVATTSSLEDHVPFEVRSLDSTSLLKIGAVCDNTKCVGDSQNCVDEHVSVHAK